MNILVTGATGGVGSALVLRLLEHGHRVFAAGRRPSSLFEVQRKAPAGAPLDLIQLDLCDPESLEEARVEVLERTGGYGLDAIVHAAGMAEVGPMMTITPAALTRHFETNVTGPVALDLAFLPQMRARKRGMLLHVGGIVDRLTLAMHGAYGTSMHALRAITGTLRQELSVFGVDVLLVETGSIRTPFVEDAFDGLDAKRWSGSRWNEVLDRLETLRPIAARVGVNASEVAEELAELVSDPSPPASRRITGPFGTVQLLANRLLPVEAFDALVRRTVALPKAILTKAPAAGGTVLVTGAAGGMGSAATMALANRGLNVLATDVDPHALEALSARCERAQLGHLVRTKVMDVTSPASIGEALGASEERTFEALVHTAGIATAGPLDLLSREAIREQLNVNVVGLLRVIRAVVPRMCDQRQGRIIALSSIAGSVSAPFFGAYHASEFATRALTAALRQELGHFGVGVTLVSPGFVATGLIEAARESLETMEPGGWSELFAQADSVVDRLRRAGGSARQVGKTIARVAVATEPPPYVSVAGRLEVISKALPLAPRSVLDRVFFETFGLRRVKKALDQSS